MAMAALVDELIEEILRRLPPSEPSCLVCAALVCKRWCGIVSDAGFRRRFRQFHGAPPALAAVYNAVDGCVLLRDMPPVGKDLYDSYVSVFHVWDPVTNKQWEVPFRPLKYPHMFYRVMVLCAAASAAGGSCNHLDCHGGPFFVIIVGAVLDNVFIYNYSSESAVWSKAATIHLDATLNSYIMLRPDLVSGDSIYFIFEDGYRILKYDLVGHVISMMSPPSLHGKGVSLVEAKDGGLGVTDVEGYNLYIWSRRDADSNGVEMKEKGWDEGEDREGEEAET